LDEASKLIEHALVFSLTELIERVSFYAQSFEVYLGVDAPLSVPNETGNRQIEKDVQKDFAKYKISMLPVNKKIMSKFSAVPRGEVLREHLDLEHMYEVYPHSSIAVLFNDYKILPYKQKSGRKKEVIIKALRKYKTFLKAVVVTDAFFDYNLDGNTFKQLKDYEDVLDAITSAYTLLYCYLSKGKCKEYKDENVVFITPI